MWCRARRSRCCAALSHALPHAKRCANPDSNAQLVSAPSTCASNRFAPFRKRHAHLPPPQRIFRAPCRLLRRGIARACRWSSRKHSSLAHDGRVSFWRTIRSTWRTSPRRNVLTLPVRQVFTGTSSAFSRRARMGRALKTEKRTVVVTSFLFVKSRGGIPYDDRTPSESNSRPNVLAQP